MDGGVLLSSFHGSRILLTGGAGFIGTALVRRLLEGTPEEHGPRIRVFDNLRRNALRDAGLFGHPRVEVLEGDVRDFSSVRAAVKGTDYVVHLASVAGVDTVIENPVTTMEVSLLGTMNVLRAAREQGGMRRFVDFSTSEVFGTHAYRAAEGDATRLGAVGEARWTYAVSKLATEHLTHNHWKQFNLPAVAVRPFNIYGPGQVGEGAVHAFVVRALCGEPLQIHNEGDQIRSWCFVEDIVDATLLTLLREEAVGNTFNVGNPRSTVTTYQLASMIKSLAQSDSPLEFVKWDFPDVELRIPNVRKAENLLGFRAKVELHEGLLRTIEWYRKRDA